MSGGATGSGPGAGGAPAGAHDTASAGTAVRVVLASQSPRRRELLNQLGIVHEVRPAHIDETPFPNEAPGPHSERLAREKAASIAREAPDAIVIGSDTIVVLDGDIMGKPRDAADAQAMLRRLAGRTHTVHTALAIAHGGAVHSSVEVVAVTMREADDAELAAYVATGEPMDKAGAYGIQGYGAALVERIDGDYFAVMGLPLQRLVAMLRNAGYGWMFGAVTRAG